MDIICNLCRCKGRKLTLLHETSYMTIYEQIINEINTNNITQNELSACWECVSALRKCKIFKERVLKSYQDLLDVNKKDICNSSNLQIHSIHNFSWPDLIKSEFNIFDEDEKPTVDIIIDQVAPNQYQHVALEKVKEEIEDRIHSEETFAEEINEEYKYEAVKEKVKKITKSNPKIKKKKKLKKIKSSNSKIAYNQSENEDDALDDFNDGYISNEDELENNSKIDDKKNDDEETISKITTNQSQPSSPAQVKDEREDTHIGKEVTVKKVNRKSKYKLTVLKMLDREVTIKSTNDKYIEPVLVGERYQCIECKKTFSSTKTYKYHLNVLHKGQNNYPCPRCGKIYQWKSNLGRHLRTHKALDTGELYCETCDKKFASIATYRQHLKISRRHVPESQFSFSCKECNKKFVTKTRLRDHMDWEHLNKIKFRCQLCGKPFKCHTSLYVHLQNVHKNKEQKDNLCHVCGKSYQNAAKLKYHITAMHSGETPYRCDQCTASFGWYSSLYRHTREVHDKVSSNKKTKRSKKTDLSNNLHLNETQNGSRIF